MQIIREGGDDTFDLEQWQILENRKKEKENDIAVVEEEEDVLDLSEVAPIAPVTDITGQLNYNQLALQRYVLHCAQNINGGGLRDKPGKSRDFYHSCYALSGLAVSQTTFVARISIAEGSITHIGNSAGNTVDMDSDRGKAAASLVDAGVSVRSHVQVYGDPGNVLHPTSCVYNIGLRKLKFALNFFKEPHLPSTHNALLHAYQEQVTG